MARFTITLSDDMHQKLKEQAERDHRTLGQEIAYLIELYVPAYQKTSDVGIPSTPSISIPENSMGRPIITNDYNDYNSYYQPTITVPAPAPRKRTIQ